MPADRWDVDRYYDPDAFVKDAGAKTPSKWGGFLPDVPFDPLRYGIPPRSIASIGNDQLLSLEVAAAALGDAGYADRPFDRERTSVIFGAEAGTDLAQRLRLPGRAAALRRRRARGRCPSSRSSPRTRSPACWPT